MGYRDAPKLLKEKLQRVQDRMKVQTNKKTSERSSEVEEQG